MQHTPFRKYFDGTESLGCILPDIDSEIKLIEMYGTRVIAVTLNGTGGTRGDLAAFSSALEEKTGIPVVCPLEEPMEKLMSAIRQFIHHHDQLPDTTARKYHN